MALSFAMLRGWGFAAARVSLAVAVTGVWNQLAMLAFPTVALALLALSGTPHAALDTIAFIGLAIFVVVLVGFAAGQHPEGGAPGGRPRRPEPPRGASGCSGRSR